MRYNMYPKQFRNAHIPIEKRRCFVLMPFNPTFDYIYGEIKQYLLNNEYLCSRADELFGSVPIMSNVLKNILQAHFVIADLTGQNANVFYELGVAHSFKDAHNIILISQSIDDVPFDIRHLRTILYKENNIKHLTSNILKSIEDNSHYYEFFEALQKKSIIGLIHDDKKGYLDALQDSFGAKLQVVTDLLNGDTEPYGEDIVREILDSSLGMFYSSSADGNRRHLRGLMKIISALLCQCGEYAYAHEVMIHLFYENKLEDYSIDTGEVLYLQTELAINLATNKVFFSEAISWIVDYFKQSKSATVDLNRYSLERFLLTSDDVDVDAAIVNSVLHENYYVREHMADIIGEKNIRSGVDALIVQLSREDNIYATSSIITALGKLGDAKALPGIAEWFKKNEDKVVRTQHYFILKHIHISLLKLNIRDDLINTLEMKYADHLTPEAIF